MPDAPWQMSKHRFGTGFTDDFIALYFHWKFGKEWVLNNYVDTLPDEIENIDMSFAERAHQYNLDYDDVKLRDILINKLKKFDTDVYKENDYLELEKVKSILKLQ